jgi:carbon-monoxide dehydrogenase medium subunit
MLYNLREYHRPTHIDEAVQLLQRTDIKTVALAGGVSVVGAGTSEIEAVVDLSELGFDFIEQGENKLHIGAMVTLQTIVEKLSGAADGLLSTAARQTAGWHIRNAATLGGMLMGGNIHSSLSVALAALRARVRIYSQAGLATFWSDVSNQVRHGNWDRSNLVTAITISLPESLKTGYEQVGRTPADQPIVCAAAAVFPVDEGQIEATVAVGGLLQDIVLIDEIIKLEQATDDVEKIISRVVQERTAESKYLSDYLGSADYRRSVAPILTRRALTTALGKLDIHTAQ